MQFNKLVRDKIPDKIRRNGEYPVVKMLKGTDLYPCLFEKINEEVLELCDTSIDERENVIEEIGDVLEIVRSTIRICRIAIDTSDMSPCSKDDPWYIPSWSKAQGDRPVKVSEKESSIADALIESSESLAYIYGKKTSQADFLIAFSMTMKEIYELIKLLIPALGISVNEIHLKMNEKYERLGGFEDGVFLVSVSDKDD